MHDRKCLQIKTYFNFLNPIIKVFRKGDSTKMKNKYAHLNIQKIISVPYCEII